MMHRIRLATQSGSFRKLGGDGSEVEVDETFIGGKARNMHVSKRQRRITGTGGKDKTAVMGILERGGEVRTVVVGSPPRNVLQPEVKKHVEAGAALYTDALLSYDSLASEYAHQVIDHASQYVDGRVHTNGLENFWSLLKRGISGTYVSVCEPFHLFRYLDQQTFRYNNRKDTDNADRFKLALSQIVGKRLTFAEFTQQGGTYREFLILCAGSGSPLRLPRLRWFRSVEFRLDFRVRNCNESAHKIRELSKVASDILRGIGTASWLL